ncbi:MAG: hypothetical protein R3B82_01630 [Sandaracinaceae bacterium]
MRPWLALALLLGACKPTIPEGRAACSGDGDCPAGWYCRAAEARCYLTPGDAGVTDAGLDAGVDAATDASIDAAIDAGPGDEDCRRLAGPHARGASFDGECFVAACELGWADDDGRFENGCELDVSLPTGCGAPGVECPMGAACVSGATGAVCARVEQVLAFGDTSCTVDSHGDAACWGDNDTGVSARASPRWPSARRGRSSCPAPSSRWTGAVETRAAVGSGRPARCSPTARSTAGAPTSRAGRTGPGPSDGSTSRSTTSRSAPPSSAW